MVFCGKLLQKCVVVYLCIIVLHAIFAVDLY